MRSLIGFAALSCLLVTPLTGPARAGDGFPELVEVFGRISPETRVFPQKAAYPDQRSHATGVAVEATVYMEGDQGTSITVTPFFRYDAGDPERTHADLREAFLLTYGDLGDHEWELRLGVDRVFWGVVESRSLVDIVNQSDVVEHPDEKTKMGQPMVHLTWSGDWGALEGFVLTGHRPRTFPGRHGRLRTGLFVDHGLTSYEAGAGEWHVDLAARYTSNFGPLGLGLSMFDGTSREPALLLTPVAGELVLAPYYELITQYGLDAQYTSGSWLLKLEAIHRTGARNRRIDQYLRYEEKDYSAFIVGGEYAINGIWESDADLTLFAEWTRDARGRWATNGFDNDLLLAARVGLNDEPGTEFTVSVLNSLANSSRVLTAEFKRRLSDNWFLHIESTVYLDIDETDQIYDVRRDSFVGVNVDYNF